MRLFLFTLIGIGGIWGGMTFLHDRFMGGSASARDHVASETTDTEPTPAPAVTPAADDHHSSMDDLVHDDKAKGPTDHHSSIDDMVNDPSSAAAK